jgi:hypothetical protein
MNQSPVFSTLMKASCGMFTLPVAFIFFLPYFCCSKNLRLGVMSPPRHLAVTFIWVDDLFMLLIGLRQEQFVSRSVHAREYSGICEIEYGSDKKVERGVDHAGKNSRNERPNRIDSVR